MIEELAMPPSATASCTRAREWAKLARPSCAGSTMRVQIRTADPDWADARETLITAAWAWLPPQPAGA